MNLVNSHNTSTDFIQEESDDPLVAWAKKALHYCKSSNLDKFIQLKNEFQKSNISLLKETSFRDVINLPLVKKWTCLHQASSIGHSGILQELVTIGCNCNEETEDNWTPLLLVCFNGFLKCAEILLNQPSILINKLTPRGTALHMACLKNHFKVAKLLMDYHASPFIENANGEIPLQLTTKNSIFELIPKYIGKEFLSKYGGGKDELERPASYSGELYWTAAWQINDKCILLVLDMDTGNILHYNKKVNFMQRLPPDLSISLYDVNNISNIEESSIENKYFIHISTGTDIYKYYSKNIEVSASWARRLLEAAKYFSANRDSASTSYSGNTRLVSFISQEELEFEEIDEIDPNESVSYSSFEIIEEIGSGSFGKVFKAIKKTTGVRYALKVINKLELKKNNQYKYIIAECKILKSIKHPFIIDLFWAFQTPNNIYMALEYCPYSDMSKLIKNNQPIAEQDARFYIAETLLAIEYLHSLDIIYRDLKPQNILIDEYRHIKLGDFGLARANTNKSNPATTFCGSPGYLAPEIINDSGVWKPVDIYSLGICLFELIVGRLPFQESNVLKLYKQISTGKINFPNHVTSNARSLIFAMTNKNTDKRPSIIEIKQHPFFESINWKSLYQREVDPPLRVNDFKGTGQYVYFEDKDYTKIEDQMLKSLIN